MDSVKPEALTGSMASTLAQAESPQISALVERAKSGDAEGPGGLEPGDLTAAQLVHVHHDLGGSPTSAAYRRDWDAWQRPPVFHWLARHVAEEELRRVFNLGIGYVAVVPEPGDGLEIGRIEQA